MAEKGKGVTVIKKITISAGGGHGGAWKVAFADFMTAMMAFFLCMWLLSQNAETKKSISDYFSTPSVIEYQFRNFGVELTLEKLFNDLLNEPLDTVSKLMEPMDRTPNIFEFGNDKIALSYIAEQLKDDAKNIEINHNEITFLIPDYKLFNKGTAEPNSDFLTVMDNINKVTTGLDNSEIQISSLLFIDAVPEDNLDKARDIAKQRLDLVSNKIRSSLENEAVRMLGDINVKSRKTPNENLTGFIRFHITRTTAKTPEHAKSGDDTNSLFDSQEKKQDLYQELNDSFKQKVREK